MDFACLYGGFRLNHNLVKPSTALYHRDSSHSPVTSETQSMFVPLRLDRPVTPWLNMSVPVGAVTVVADERVAFRVADVVRHFDGDNAKGNVLNGVDLRVLLPKRQVG